MPRFINPAPEYKPNSKLFFFRSGTNTQLVTYKDATEKTPNTHPVLTDSAGVVPNIFFSGTAKLIVKDENNVQYLERDPVGGDSASGSFTIWEEPAVYDLNSIVEGSDGAFYISLSNNNQGNDPTSESTSWSEIRFIEIWNENVTYSIGVVVQTSEGNLWRATTATTNNNPVTDDGTNWLPAVDVEGMTTQVTGNFEAVAGVFYVITGSADITMPAIVTGQIFRFSAVGDGVRMLNPAYTLSGGGADIVAGDNMTIANGNTAVLTATTTSTMRAV